MSDEREAEDEGELLCGKVSGRVATRHLVPIRTNVPD